MIKCYVSNKEYFFKETKLEKTEKKKNIEVLQGKLQKIIGFGGAITESSSYIYSLMNKENKEKFIDLYYGKEGLNYNLGRVTIGSCDFSIDEYDYIENGDLSTFNLEHEKKYLFPLLNDIYKKKEIRLIASSWSAPKEFKTSNDKCHGKKLRKIYRKTYGKYIAKYVSSMQNLGYKLEMLSIQNEPLATQTWESMKITPLEEKELIYIVNEELKKENKSVEFYIYDHNRDKMNWWADKVLNDDDYLNLITGIAYHWYDKDFHQELKIFHDNYENKNILFTEGCIELLQVEDKDTFKYALRYAKDYMMDLLNYSNGFIDWNILLDENGGPNHVGNYCGSLIQYDKVKEELIINPSYYFVKHFSHFLNDNFYRFDIINKTECNVAYFKDNNNNEVIIILNLLKEDREVVFEINNQNYLLKLCPDSIATVQIWKGG